MAHKTRRKTVLITSAVLAASLLLSGCSNANEHATNHEALEAIKVHDEGESFKVELDGEVKAEDISTRVIKEGDGDKVEEGDILRALILTVDPETGEPMGADKPMTQLIPVNKPEGDQADDPIFKIVSNAKIGSIFSVYVPMPEGTGAKDQLMVVEIDGKVPTSIDGDPQELPEGFPQVTDQDEGAPKVDVTGMKKQDTTHVAVRKEGQGRTIEASDQLLVNYHGVKASDGSTFDSSFGKDAPASFPLDGVIKGWRDGLVGQKEGSQVVLVVPPKEGYGENKGHELEKETLVFVVDILYSQAAAEPAQP